MTASIASRDAVPPPCEPVSYIELESTKDSKIVGVSVYSGRAEITRLFTFDVKTGQNQVNIAGLPAVLDEESVKVEGRGTATIHDVTISRITAPPNQTISAELESLLFDQKANEKALKRAQRALSTLETYMASISAANLDVSKLGDIVKNYDETARNLDYDVTNFEVESKNLASAIDAERLRLNGPIIDEKLNVKVAIGLFADFEGEIEVAVIYAVGNANWMAGYDIRVDMQAHENPITLVYKASITQNTGENWSDVPLTLETATLSFGIGVPTLHPWALTTQAPYFALHSQNIAMTSAKRLKRSDSPPRASLTRVLSRTAEPDLTSSWASRAAAPIAHRELQVSSMGNVTATFRVPGLIDIPSDGIGHNVTIVKLLLGADMSWVCVPKQDARVHLKAKIKNASDYTLLAGKASVYVDGSFISRSMFRQLIQERNLTALLGSILLFA